MNGDIKIAKAEIIFSKEKNCTKNVKHFVTEVELDEKYNGYLSQVWEDSGYFRSKLQKRAYANIRDNR